MANANLNRSGVYRITCIANGRIYIGSAKNIRMRWKLHRTHLRMGIHHNRPLQSTWRKYPESDFVFDVLEFCDLGSVIETEQKWLDQLRPYERGIGFNVLSTAYSSVGLTHTDETRKKLVEIARQRDHTRLRQYNEERRGKPNGRKGEPGIKWTAEQKAAASAARKGQKAWNKGIPHPEDVKKKIAATLMVKKRVISEEVRARIKELRALGLSYPKISEETGVSISQCHKIQNDIVGRDYRRQDDQPADTLRSTCA